MLNEIIEKHEYFYALIKKSRKLFNEEINSCSIKTIELICEICLNCKKFLKTNKEQRLTKYCKQLLSFSKQHHAKDIFLSEFTIRKQIKKYQIQVKQIIKLVLDKLVVELFLSVCDCN